MEHCFFSFSFFVLQVSFFHLSLAIGHFETDCNQSWDYCYLPPTSKDRKARQGSSIAIKGPLLHFLWSLKYSGCFNLFPAVSLISWFSRFRRSLCCRRLHLIWGQIRKTIEYYYTIQPQRRLSKHCLAKKHRYQTKQNNTLFELKQYYSKYVKHYFLGMQYFSSKCLSLRHDMIGSKNSVFGPDQSLCHYIISQWRMIS